MEVNCNLKLNDMWYPRCISIQCHCVLRLESTLYWVSPTYKDGHVCVSAWGSWYVSVNTPIMAGSMSAMMTCCLQYPMTCIEVWLIDGLKFLEWYYARHRSVFVFRMLLSELVFVLGLWDDHLGIFRCFQLFCVVIVSIYR